ncbi:PREDICTED: 39S ribosomal protein L3, mitochondrial [Papilio xuthus]|uniref:Large ribosomal subunit protein uL3m n=1 Tax=Papilio xuthus TaxID=66420 RepID=A0A194PN09_PAPXU|nr:PREDICTED: 39S ribosomal protein L3, mitochondrial [Papilio xuthus]KPI94702.1 39S ribosomal protein L3, mitochondrial [Papilio xuthus]
MATSNMKILCSTLSRLRVDYIPIRQNAFYKPPKYRPPHWFVPKERVMSEDFLTQENRDFIEEIIQDKRNSQIALESPLAHADQQTIEWNPFTRRVGLIARKIGNYPLWSKEGKKYQTTLLQVVDNHVIKYVPPEQFNPMKTTKVQWKEKKTLGCLLVGSETVDPSTVTKEYSGIFNSVGMLPKRHLFRFMVSPHAALPTGTPLFATHFRVGDHIDVRAKTMDRGFQGVMKRWGFSGMPASHGVTKTHRRPGNIGGGGEKARVWPGTKMPGHMGNRWRTLRGVKILRINTKYNILWTLGVAIPGETGAVCYLYDTILPLKKLKTAPPFPTHPASDDLPLEYYDESIHPFEGETILFDEV